jgi:hypothetical protein
MKNFMDEKNLIVDGKPFFMRGAELHYFRLPRQLWKKHIKMVKEAGMNTVTACMPWHFHEPEEGIFDFDGSSMPERDLRGFIELVKDSDLKLIAHPGPFLNCEFRFGGIPEWLFRNYPETLSRKGDGSKTTGRPIPAEGEALYRKFVKKWYAQIVPVLAEFQISNGGPVILFQADNELSAAWSYGLLNSLYDPTVVQEAWPSWLEKRYKKIEKLNFEYNSSFTEFVKIEPPKNFPENEIEKSIAVDWLNFKRWFFADWGATLAGWSKEFGLEVPVIFNEPVAGFYGHGDHAGFGRILKDKGVSGASVCHSYSERILDLEGIVNPSLGVELVKSSSWGGPPLSVEVNCNWYMPRLSRSAVNWGPLLRCLLGHGLKGFSVFTFSEGKADLDDSIEGPEYFADTGLNVSGEKAAGYKYLERFNRLVQTWEDSLLDAVNVDDITLCYSGSFRISDFLGFKACCENIQEAKGPGGDSFDAEPGLDKGTESASHDWLDGYENVSKQNTPAEAGLWGKFKEVYILLSRLNLSFNLLDMTNPNMPSGKSCMIVPCVGTLEKESIDFLLEHIDKGGRVLFFPTIPIYDMNGNRDERIGQKLGVTLKGQIRPAGGKFLDYGARKIDLPDGKQITAGGWIWPHDFPNKSEIVASFENDPIAAKTGNVLVAGFDARFTTYSTLNFWKNAIRDTLNIKPAVITENNYYYAKMLEGESGSFLTVMNITGNTVPALIKLDNGLKFELELGEYEARILPVNVCLNGRKIVYSTSEIIQSDDGKFYELHGSAGTSGCIVFADSDDIYLNGEVMKPRSSDGNYIVEYEHGSKPLRLVL